MRKGFLGLLSVLIAILLAGCGGGSGSNITTLPSAPAAPTGLSTTVADGQVALSWTAAPGATTYNVYYSTTSGVTTGSGTKVSGITSASDIVKSLTDGTAYYFIVTAVNATGESAASSQVSATPEPAAPVAPTGLAATAGSLSVSLSWTASAGATTYNVYYGTASPVTTSSTEVTGITGTSTTISSLTAGATYYFAVTARNGGGDSALSASASATPLAGSSVAITPGTPTSATVAVTGTTSLTFGFTASALTEDATIEIAAVDASQLPVALSRKSRAHASAVPTDTGSGDVVLGAFQITAAPESITSFNAPVQLAGNVGSAVAAASTVNLAMLSGNAWMDVATMVVGNGGALNENLVSFDLPGLLAPGTYVLYKPALGSNTSVSNLGVALVMHDAGNPGAQIVGFYDPAGNLLATPTVSTLDQAGDQDAAITPDGSQGVLVSTGRNYDLALFSGLQTGSSVMSASTVGTSVYGGAEAEAVLPNGDEAVELIDTAGMDCESMLVVSGILSGSPVPAETIALTGEECGDLGIVMSKDGKVLMVRGWNTPVTIFSVAPISPVAGNAGGTIAHSFTKMPDLTVPGGFPGSTGRQGMAISPADSSRAVLETMPAGSGISGINADGVALVTGLPSAPVVGPAINIPNGDDVSSIAISPDGKLAVVGTGTVGSETGLLLFSGVDTGNLTQVGGPQTLTYTLNGDTVTIGDVPVLGISLDGKYVIAVDSKNSAIVVVPFSSTGFSTPIAAQKLLESEAPWWMIIH